GGRRNRTTRGSCAVPTSRTSSLRRSRSTFLGPGNGVIGEFFTVGDQAGGGEVQAGDGDPGQSRSQDVQDHQVLGQGQGVLDIAQDPLCHRQDEQSGGGETNRTSGAGAVSHDGGRQGPDQAQPGQDRVDPGDVLQWQVPSGCRGIASVGAGAGGHGACDQEK